MPRLALAAALLCITAATATAQSVAGNLELDEFHPAMDARGYLTLNGSQVLDGGELSFGLGSLDWGRHLLEFQSGSSSYAVDNMVSATLVSALGLNVAGVPFEVGASLPLTVMDGEHNLDGQGVGDLGLHVKARLLHAGPWGLGALASVYLPTANPSDKFLGDSGVTPQLMLITDVNVGRWRFTANGGVRLRQTATFTDMTMGTMGTVTASTELPLGVGAAFALSPEKLELIAEVYGDAPLGASHDYQPLEALGGVKVYLAKSSYLTIGAGRGLLQDQGGNPDFRAFIGIVFEPKPAEQRVGAVTDDDVVAIAPPPVRKPHVDPDADRDGDGVPDIDDRCPDVPGPLYNHGCPDDQIAVVDGSTIVVLKSIDFEFDSAKLKDTAFPVLDAVVKALDDNPDITKVEVQGHTDERGSAAYNLDLSDRRAASVVTYLTEHGGVAAGRLESHGYGKTRPIDPAHNEAAWAKNRRVEFIIKERNGLPATSP
ncbi:MAG TPA: OmpA family protein [Kofleriaceae bacterium]|nr:OmpA family protein [Kofleriaceae bacterium]